MRISDWSSDVCSSDLQGDVDARGVAGHRLVDFVKHLNTSKDALFSKVGSYEMTEEDQEVEVAFQWNTGYNADGIHSFANGINKIGRASCRERVCQYV